MRDYQEVSTMDSGDSPRGGTKHFRNKFFDAHAPIYMTNNFTRGTLWEVDFLVEELALRPGARILDVGCGTGRHLIELARRGYRVTNVDLSGGMLRQAMASAASLDQRPDWVRANATRFSLRPVHDAAICICEGALGLLATAKIRSNTIQRFSRTSTARRSPVRRLY
jgi:ubiquinone/menaquinone biosynthesis C-methylase UbiE